MSPAIASLIFAIGILGLFVLDGDPKARTSKALWLPLVWILIAGSRNIGEWLQVGPPAGAGDQYLEGNPLDRNILAALVALGIIVLFSRRHRIAVILKANPAIILYFSYCVISVLWSDYPYVGLKRWIRASGDLVMVLIVLSDSNPLPALKQLLERAGFVLIPISVLLIRYYPDLGRVYGEWDATVYWTGVSTTKNGLGMICLIFGVGCMWRFLGIWRHREDARRRRQLLAQGSLLAMVLWLLWIANSMTSLSCFLIATVVILATSLRVFRQRPALVHLLVCIAVCASFAVLFLNVSAGTLQTMGRDPSLTGRTDVWNVVLKFVDNPLFGAGYESFWLGKRLQGIRSEIGGINQCHNGYLEIYVNLGFAGLALLGGVMVTGYRKIMAALRRDPEVGQLTLAYFVVGVIYNFTEAGVKMMSPVWIFFLIAIMTLPRASRKKAEELSRDDTISPQRILALPSSSFSPAFSRTCAQHLFDQEVAGNRE